MSENTTIAKMSERAISILGTRKELTQITDHTAAEFLILQIGKEVAAEHLITLTDVFIRSGVFENYTEKQKFDLLQRTKIIRAALVDM